MRLSALFALLFCSLAVTAAEIDQRAALQLLQRPDTMLVDVRTAAEFADGALPGAQRIETRDLPRHIGRLVPDKSTPIVVYCRSGRRSAAAREVLLKLGYQQVINAGGYARLVDVLGDD